MKKMKLEELENFYAPTYYPGYGYERDFDDVDWDYPSP